MKTIMTIMVLIASGLVMATPPNFQLGAKQIVYVDFLEVDYDVTFDIAEKRAHAVSRIFFQMSTEGYPVFDLKEEPTTVIIDGVETDAQEISDPDRESKIRIVNKKLAAGNHTLIIHNFYTENTRFSDDSISAAFWMSDLTDRNYLEQYLPTNLEYDQYRSTLNVHVKGTSVEHEVFTNGEILAQSAREFTINFPDYFTASSFFFHISKKNEFERVQFNFQSISGNAIPVIAYSRSAWSLRNLEIKITDILNELEGKFGAWSHPSLVAYITGWGGGMEHAGATQTSLSALGHEITHSFFARGVLPINGNSGWMDEAIASWRDDSYPSKARIDFSPTQMSGHSLYRRTTDRKAYTSGASFMAFLNHKLSGLGGLEAFLSHIYSMWVHRPIYTEMFQAELQRFATMDLSSEFDRYIYGKDGVDVEHDSQLKHRHMNEHNPYHPHLTKEQLLEML